MSTIKSLLVDFASLRLSVAAAVSALLIYLVALVERGSNGLVYRTLLIIVVLVVVWLVLLAAENARAIVDYFKNNNIVKGEHSNVFNKHINNDAQGVTRIATNEKPNKDLQIVTR